MSLSGDGLAASIELSRAYRVMSRMSEMLTRYLWVMWLVGWCICMSRISGMSRGLSWLRKLKRHYGVMLLKRGDVEIESDRWGAELGGT